MSLSGLFLCTFLLGHVSGNFQLLIPGFAGKMQFNQYAVFMTTNPAVKVLSYLTYFSILLHVVYAIILNQRNKAARPVAYAYSKPGSSSSWSSRNMVVLGVVILAFIAFHLADFWYEYKFAEMPYMETEAGDGYVAKSGQPYPGATVEDGMIVFNGTVIEPAMKDLHEEVLEAFSNWYLMLFYVIVMGFIAFHLVHGVSSGFQSLGVNHPKYTPLIKKISMGFGVVVPAAFAVIAIACFLLGTESEAGYLIIKPLF